MNEYVISLLFAAEIFFTVTTTLCIIVLFRRMNRLVFALTKVMDIVKPEGWEEVKKEREEQR